MNAENRLKVATRVILAMNRFEVPSTSYSMAGQEQSRLADIFYSVTDGHFFMNNYELKKRPDGAIQLDAIMYERGLSFFDRYSDDSSRESLKKMLKNSIKAMYPGLQKVILGPRDNVNSIRLVFSTFP